jgi:hypothetical protein
MTERLEDLEGRLGRAATVGVARLMPMQERQAPAQMARALAAVAVPDINRRR